MLLIGYTDASAPFIGTPVVSHVWYQLMYRGAEATFAIGALLVC